VPQAGIDPAGETHEYTDMYLGMARMARDAATRSGCGRIKTADSFGRFRCTMDLADLVSCRCRCAVFAGATL
jgi:hypothetical protein